MVGGLVEEKEVRGETSILAMAANGLRSPPEKDAEVFERRRRLKSMKQPRRERSSTTGTLGAAPLMSSSMTASGSRTLYWSWARRSR